MNSLETWVVVASASRADIYVRHKKHGALEAVQRLTEPKARAKEQELVADEPGRTFDSGGQGRHAMEPKHSEKERLLVDFAKRIAQVIEAARKANQFGQLNIVATPAMLGQLRKQLDGVTVACITAEFSKELTGSSPEDVARLLDS